ncbi:hypothetical protein [Streptomyces sp. NPDC052015]|uniref:hypothetical protein n=1 Tax=Streptomyces sp. NPDC052015 TaxID=3154755 RepID=UPI00342E6943
MDNSRRALAALALVGAALTVTGTAQAAPVGQHKAANPSPVLPGAESLITEGLTIEGPLINNFGLPKLI